MVSFAPAEKAPTGKPLKVGSPHDPAEREADHIADILTAPEEPALPVCAACVAGGAPCAACGGGVRAGVLQRQRLGSNRSGLLIQAKLKVGDQNDAYEQEADRVAEQVMRMAPATSFATQRRSEDEQRGEIPLKSQAKIITPAPQLKNDATDEVRIETLCETHEQEEQIQRSAIKRLATQSDLEHRLSTSKGGGRPLPDDVRLFMEPRFNVDFTQVRVHADGDAVQMSQELGAQAFTSGSHIYYGFGRSAETDHLTAHELVHVVQQTGHRIGQSHGWNSLKISPSPTEFVQQDRVRPEDIADRLSEDLIYERLAQIVYLDEMTDWAIQQLRRSDMGFRWRELREGAFDFQMRGFETDENHQHFPVLAFRGSQEFMDFVDDFNPQGVGDSQLRRNLNLIEQEIDDMGGRVDVTGHSLGGVLAQLAAVVYPNKVRRVITFQAPGLPVGIIDSLVSYNNRVPEEQRVESTHYRGILDLAHYAGYGFTPGSVYTLPVLQPTSSIRSLAAHSARLLEVINRLRRQSPDQFRELDIEMHQSSTGQDARGFRPYEILRHQLLGIAFHDLLAWLGGDNAVARRVLQDPGYLQSLSFEQKQELIAVLLNSELRDDNLFALVAIIRSMTVAERVSIHDEIMTSRLPGSHTLPLMEAFDSTEPLDRTIAEGAEDAELDHVSPSAELTGSDSSARVVLVHRDDVYTGQPRDVTETGHRYIIVEFYARIEPENEDVRWGRAHVRSRWDQGQYRYVPSDDSTPSMSINNRGISIDGQIVNLVATGFSFTRYALEAFNQAYASRDLHGRMPVALRGDLAQMNLLIFQRNYFRIRRVTELRRIQIAEQAIHSTPFGRHRSELGYADFEFTLGSDTEVDLDSTPLERDRERLGIQSVPGSVSVVAMRRRSSH